MDKYIEQNPNETSVYIPVPANFKDTTKVQNVDLMVGMPIICKKTKKEKNKDWHILNSDMYSVVHIQDEKFHFQLKNDYDAPIITMAQKDFHTYFYLGFCITAHASQGSTIHEPFTIYDWNHRYFNDTAKYVCLSRATTIEHINIMC